MPRAWGYRLAARAAQRRPAVVGLMVTLPAGSWLQKRGSISRKVFWASVGHRLVYAVWIFLPFFLLPQGQINALIALVF